MGRVASGSSWMMTDCCAFHWWSGPAETGHWCAVSSIVVVYTLTTYSVHSPTRRSLADALHLGTSRPLCLHIRCAQPFPCPHRLPLFIQSVVHERVSVLPTASTPVQLDYPSDHRGWYMPQ
ncbi:hypothetical protein BDW22DRAFT_1352944 [Trametopsis cervina]|nr:hypothetical protein BDW22DRAFT_1352944 [Trametopsis cervina]